MSSEIPVRSYLSSNTNTSPESPSFTSDPPLYLNMAGSNTRHSGTMRSDSLASAAAMAAISKHPSGSTPMTPNKYQPRQTPLTPPMSPAKTSERHLASPTKPSWPEEKYFTSPRSPPSPPRQELHAQEPESRYHRDSNNILFPKTLRQQQEPEMNRTETPTKQGFFRRSLTLKRQSPSPPRQEVNASDPGPTHHTASNNIVFPKTLRNQQEQQVRPADATSPRQAEAPPQKQGFFRRSLTMRRQRTPPSQHGELQGSDVMPKYHTESNNILFPKTLRQSFQESEKSSPVASEDVPLSPSRGQAEISRQPYPEQRAKPEEQEAPLVIGKHTGLANKTLRRSKTQRQPQPRPQSPSITYTPLSRKSLRLAPEESKGIKSQRSMRSSPRETPQVRGMADSISPSYEHFQAGDSGPRKTVTTDVRRTHLPAVTHEHIQPVTHHVNVPKYTREIHNHDIINRTLPIRDTQVLPARHYAPSPSDPRKLVEIPAPAERLPSAQAPAAPISMDMASNTKCYMDASAKFHSPIDNTIIFSPIEEQQPTAETRVPSSQYDPATAPDRRLVSQTSRTLPDGTEQTVSVWQYKPTMKTPAREVTETVTRPPRADWSMSPSATDEDIRRYMSPNQPSTYAEDDDGRTREQELLHPSVVSEWSQVPKPSPSPGRKAQVDMRSGVHRYPDEINIQDYRSQEGLPTEIEPVSQRPTRPTPSRASPRSVNKPSFLSSITGRVAPENLNRHGTPGPPGTFETRDAVSEYSSATSQQPSPAVTPKAAESKTRQRRKSGELLPPGIWQRHSLVIPAGVVKNGQALMGAGKLMENRQKEEELAKHRLKKVSKPEADRVAAIEGAPPKVQNKNEMEKVARRRNEERMRQASVNQDIQRLLAAETKLNQEQEALNQEDSEVARLEEKANKVIEEEDRLEGEIDVSKRRRSMLLREAEAEYEKAEALHEFKQGEPNEPGPRALQAHRRRRSNLLHDADTEQERTFDLEQQKDDALAQMPQREANIRAGLDTALEDAMSADESRQEEVRLQNFLDDEVKRQKEREEAEGPSKAVFGTEEEGGQWTKVMKPKSGKTVTKGNGTQVPIAQQQNELPNRIEQGRNKGFAAQLKPSSPPKGTMPQGPWKTPAGSGLHGTQEPVSRSWANIAASKPVTE